MPKISIVLPTYNGELYLAEQIESILAQTAEDFELLAIDDGSTDNTVSVLDAFAQKDKRIRRLPASGNQGQNRRLIRLFSEALGEFIAVADQDDIWLPDRNEILLRAVETNAIAFGRSDLIDANGSSLGKTILGAFGIDPTNPSPLRMLFSPLVSAHCAIVRRDWIDPAVMYGPHPFDWMMALEASLSSGLVYADDAVVLHRIHGKNQMNGLALGRARSRISLYQLRESTSFVASDRLYLFLMLDQVSRSSAISKEIREKFREAANVCRYTWYQPLKFDFSFGGKATSDLMRLLGPLAISSADRSKFEQRIRVMAKSQWAPTNIVRAVSHYIRYSDPKRVN